MGLISRKISINSCGEKVELLVKLQRNCFDTIIQLLINDLMKDEIATTPEDGVMGCELQLNGSLNTGFPVRAEIRANFFMRPLYTIYVDEKEVVRKKGTWGGM